MKQEEKILHIAENDLQERMNETLKLSLLLKLLQKSFDSFLDSANNCISKKDIEKLDNLVLNGEFINLTWILELATEYCQLINTNLDILMMGK